MEGSLKSYTQYLTFNTKKHREFINLTEKVTQEIEKSTIQEGFCLVSAMHITAGVFINDNELGLLTDIESWLNKLAPEGQNYNHHKTGETNGDAHLRNLVIGHQVTVPVTKGRPDLGPWQSIFYAEFDGQRDKKILIKIIGE